MFRYVLQIAFIRRVLQFRFIRFTLLVMFAGALIAGLIYASVVFHAVTERNSATHVQHNSSH
jgi:hypothetical protein